MSRLNYQFYAQIFRLSPDPSYTRYIAMDEETRITFKGSCRSMTTQDSVCPQGDTEVKPKKQRVCSSIVFDTKRMNWIRTNGDVDKQSIKENSSTKDQEIIENRNASENLNAMRNDDDLRTNLLGKISNTALRIPSSMDISADCLESANREGNKRCQTFEAEELMDTGCRTVGQSSAPVKPNLDERLQTATVSSGKATMYAANAELVDSLDFDDNGRDGLFWKMSEFHRRSGKQGLEERFEHLSPTVIAQCSAILQDQGKDISAKVQMIKNFYS